MFNSFSNGNFYPFTLEIDLLVIIISLTTGIFKVTLETHVLLIEKS